MAKFFKKHKIKFGFSRREPMIGLDRNENLPPLRSALKKSTPVSCDLQFVRPSCSEMRAPAPKKVCFTEMPCPEPPETYSLSRASGARLIPRTNPYYTIPRRTQLDYDKLRAINGDFCSWSSTTATTTTFSIDDDKSVSSDSTTSTQSSTTGFTKILAGLKSLGIKGELYISVIVNESLLTISVEEARDLVGSPEDEPCNSYVRLSLMPDEEKRTQCKTNMVLGSNYPVFNQTFSVELVKGDDRRRLLISLWHRDLNAGKSHLLGCMAFSMKHLMHRSKCIEGWYFLLSPTFGRHKHLAVDKVNMLTYYGSVDRGLNFGNRPASQPCGAVWL